MTEELIKYLLPVLSGPAGVAVGVWWIKRKIEHIEKIPEILLLLKNLEEKIVEFKAENKLELQKLNATRDDFIILKQEVKAQWRHIDDLKAQFKLMS